MDFEPLLAAAVAALVLGTVVLAVWAILRMRWPPHQPRSTLGQWLISQYRPPTRRRRRKGRRSRR